MELEDELKELLSSETVEVDLGDPSSSQPIDNESDILFDKTEDDEHINLIQE